MSQHSTADGNAELVVTPTKKRKRKASPECEVMKITMPNAQKVCKTGICPKVKTNVKAMSQLADPPDMVQSVSHLDQCIPLWPQYKLSAAGSKYLKVAPTEQWLVQYVGYQRKLCRKDNTECNTKGANESYRLLCKKLLLEFKKVVAETKDKYKKQYKKEFPSELAVTLGGCLISASTCTRQLLIRVDKDVNKWIHEGFHSFVRKHFEGELKTLKAISQPRIACGEDCFATLAAHLAIGTRFSGTPRLVRGALSCRNRNMRLPTTASSIPSICKPAMESLVRSSRKQGEKLFSMHALPGTASTDLGSTV